MRKILRNRKICKKKSKMRLKKLIFIESLTLFLITCLIPIIFLWFSNTSHSINYEESSKLEALNSHVKILKLHFEEELLKYKRISNIIGVYQGIYDMVNWRYQNTSLDIEFEGLTPEEKVIGDFYPKRINYTQYYKDILDFFLDIGLNNSILNIEMLRVFYRDGNILVGTINGTEDLVDYRGQKYWFPETLNMTNPSEINISPISCARATNTTAIRIIKPIIVNSSTKGIFIANYNAMSLTWELMKDVYSKGSFSCIVDPNYMNAEGQYLGEVYIAHNLHPNLMFDETNAGKIDFTTKDFEPVTENKQLTKKIDNQNYIYSFLPASISYQNKEGNQTRTWYVISCEPIENFTSVSESTFLQDGQLLVGILLILICFITIFSVFLSRSIANPIVQLNKIAIKFAKGNLQDPITHNAPGDIGELENSIEIMRSNLLENLNKLYQAKIVAEKAENEIVENQKQLVLINSILNMVFQGRNLKNLIEMLFLFLLSEIKFDGGCIHIVNPKDQDRFDLTYHLNLATSFISQINSINVKNKQILNFKKENLIQTIENFQEKFLDQQNGRSISLIIIPLMCERGMIGSLTIAFYKPLILSESEKRLFAFLSKEVGTAIYYHQLQEERDCLLQSSIQLSEMKSNLISIVSHELLTPIIPIIGWTEIIKKALETGKSLNDLISYEEIESIYRNAIRLETLIKQYLDLGRIETGRFILNCQKSNIDEIVISAINSVDYLIKAKQMILLNEIQPTTIFVDRIRIEEVLINLLSNAVKYSPEKTNIHIRGFTEQRKGKRLYIIQIKDEGYGFTDSELENAIEPFSKISMTQQKKKNTPGTGLGLYISQKIISSHDGTLKLYSNGSDQGTLVEICLPFSSSTPVIGRNILNNESGNDECIIF